MRIDADQRFTAGYDASTVAGILARNRFDGAIIAGAPHEVLAHDFILGAIGTLEDRHPKLRAVRIAAEDESDLNWLLRPQVLDALREIEARGLACDLAARPEHLPLIPRLAEKMPNVRLVIDRMGHPELAFSLDGWSRRMEAAASCRNVYCKLSGIPLPAAPYRPCVRHLLDVFGPDRLMFGSNWPNGGRWKESLAAFTQAIGPQPMDAREQLLGGTAAICYALNF